MVEVESEMQQIKRNKDKREHSLNLENVKLGTELTRLTQRLHALETGTDLEEMR